MTRIFKHYYFEVGLPVVGISMSSYPGCVSSTDDYFLAGNGMAAMSTSLGVPATGPESEPAANNGLPSFVRSIMAMRLASTPEQWAKVYGFVHGIAGGKQWLVVNYNNLEVGSALQNQTAFLI